MHNSLRKIFISCCIAFVVIIGIVLFFRRPLSFLLIHSLQVDHLATLLNPNQPDLLMEIGNSFFGEGRVYDQSRAYTRFSKVIHLDPKRSDAHYQLGRIYFINGQFESALMEINTVIRLDPDFKKSYYMYGLINGYIGDFDAATWGFSEFIQRDSFNWAGYNDLAWISFKQGDYTKTKEIATQGLQQAPGNPWLQNTLGTALLNLGEKEAAQRSLSAALISCNQMHPNDWGGAYPGNDPRLYDRGLREMCTTIRKNIAILDTDTLHQ